MKLISIGIFAYNHGVQDWVDAYNHGVQDGVDACARHVASELAKMPRNGV